MLGALNEVLVTRSTGVSCACILRLKSGSAVGHWQVSTRAIVYRLCHDDPDFTASITQALVSWMTAADVAQLAPAWTIVRSTCCLFCIPDTCQRLANNPLLPAARLLYNNVLPLSCAQVGDIVRVDDSKRPLHLQRLLGEPHIEHSSGILPLLGRQTTYAEHWCCKSRR